MAHDHDIVRDLFSTGRQAAALAAQDVAAPGSRRLHDERGLIDQPRRIRANGIEMSVLVTGNGPDVLLVHGFPDTHEVWRLQIPLLVEAGYRA